MKRVNGPWSGLERYMEIREAPEGREGDQAKLLLDRFGDSWATRLHEFVEDSAGVGCKCKEVARKLEEPEEK